MECFIDRTTLFAFDLDGTLAPIGPDPDTIGIPVTIQKEIITLGGVAQVAIITGRSRSDALQRLSVLPRYLIGNHGAEGLPGWESRTLEFIQTVKEWQDQLTSGLSNKDQNGILIENKGPTLSVHYRHAADSKTARVMILSAINRLFPQPRLISGIYIENLVPKGAPDKGVALKHLMNQAGCPKGFFVGDDETDEDVFRLDKESILTVRVGRKVGSLSRFYLRNQQEIARLLRVINRIIR
ncbi:MAG: trehalose-phosphatase [Deltaproteobacteria bacterium HGW-Deltaproteobacteria-6]|nr:MAG: trehalose-phosphatase [Deltaproteobacteria bacterium HGW-Deltaproteobacteria-6]